MNLHDNSILCPCGSKLCFSVCCHPYLQAKILPPSAEALMRSRYSAYATGAFQYIFDTYATREQSNSLLSTAEYDQAKVSLAEIKKSSLHTQWCKLEICGTHEEGNNSEVEFIAYYYRNHQFYAMHECSRFIKIEGKWLYVNGQMLAKTGAVKIGRNDSCLCGSGKKFKRCCQA